jgi:hypothetical protein
MPANREHDRTRVPDTSRRGVRYEQGKGKTVERLAALMAVSEAGVSE